MDGWDAVSSPVGQTAPAASGWDAVSSPAQKPAFTATMNTIEGTGKNPNSSASGKGQFLDSTWLRTVKKYAPDVAQNKSDAEILALKGNDDAFKDQMIGHLMDEHASILQNVLGREPTAGEKYLAWQQGPSGAAALLKNPDANAIDAVAPFYKSRGLAAKAILDNGGKPDMTAGQFAQKWMAKSDPGFLERVKGDYQKRVNVGENIAEATAAGDQTAGEGYLQFAGQGAAFGNDVIGEGFKSAANGLDYVTPDWLGKPVKQAAQYVSSAVSNSPIGDVARGATEAYSDFEKNNPRFARNIDAATNIGLLGLSATPVKGAANSPATLAKQASVKGSSAGFDTADALYNKFRAQNLQMDPAKVVDLNKALDSLVPNDPLEKRIWEKSGAGEEVQAIKDASKAGLPLNSALAERSYLNSQITKSFLAKDDVTAKHLQDVRDALNDVMIAHNTGDWQAANHEFAKAATAQSLEEMVAKSVTKAQPANSLDTAINNFLNSRKSAGLKPNERALLEDVTSQTQASELKKSVAGRLWNHAGTAIGSALGGPLGAGIGFLAGHYGSMVARDSAMASKLAKLDKVYEAIAARTPPAAGRAASTPKAVNAPRGKLTLTASQIAKMAPSAAAAALNKKGNP